MYCTRTCTVYGILSMRIVAQTQLCPRHPATISSGQKKEGKKKAERRGGGHWKVLEYYTAPYLLACLWMYM